jgi:predicted RNA binding protein YcfA (HicA-like mRNA interferase family)
MDATHITGPLKTPPVRGTAPIGKAMRARRDQLGVTLRDLERRLAALGWTVSHVQLQHREVGKVTIRADERKLIAQALEMTLADFDDLWRASTIQMSRGEHGIPVINRAPAGHVEDYEEWGPTSGHGHDYLHEPGFSDDLAFAVEVVGESMEAALLAGDLCVFTPVTVPRPRKTLEPGKVAFVRFGPDAPRQGCTIARWQGMDADGVHTFTKDNPRHRGFTAPREHVEQLAALLWFRRESV